jgi:hypothetical protein
VTGDVCFVRLDEVEPLGDVVAVGNFVAAPETDMSLIKQLRRPPANSIAPDINTFLRKCARLSMKAECVGILKIERSDPFPNIAPGTPFNGAISMACWERRR